MSAPAQEVDAFLAALPADVAAALQRLRDTIRSAAPDAVEKISYGVPAFSYRGRPLVSFGAAKTHCAFYVQSPALMEALADELEPYDTAKGTIRFPADKPLPAALVRKLVKARMTETDSAGRS